MPSLDPFLQILYFKEIGMFLLLRVKVSNLTDHEVIITNTILSSDVKAQACHTDY